jgi:stage II sporulation protein AA (anti-sigma F factor antagonist)
MDIRVRIGQDERCLSLEGELDMSTVDAVLAALLPLGASEGDIRVEMSGVTFMDSTGLHAFLRVAQELGSSGTLHLIEPTPAVRRVLELTGVQSVPNVVISER